MPSEFRTFSSLLDVLGYADVPTSLDELMSKACVIMQNSLRPFKKGKGQWTWSVFSVKNIQIEQRAVGGTHAPLRNSMPRRYATSGMIGRVIQPEEESFLYENNTEQLTDDKFYRILSNTKSAIVSRIQVDNDIIGAFNIESDIADDFEKDAVIDIAIYVGKVISLIFSIEKYRDSIGRYNAMFSGALSVIGSHYKSPPKSFFKEITDLFCFDCRLEAVALFISLGDSSFYFAAHTNLELYTSKLPDMGFEFKSINTLLARAEPAHLANPLSIKDTKFSSLIDNDLESFDLLDIQFARLYSFDIHVNFQSKCILVAISNNQNAPDMPYTKQYRRLIESFTRSYIQLERKRIEDQQIVLSGMLYGLAINADTHSSFLEEAAAKINVILSASACFFLLVRPTFSDEAAPQRRFELVKPLGAPSPDNTTELNDLILQINHVINMDGNASERTHYKVPLSSRGLDSTIFADILLESPDSYAQSYSDVQIILCLVDRNQYADNIFNKAFGINVDISLITITEVVRRCMKLINGSRRNYDLMKGLEIIHKNTRNIRSCNRFDELVLTLHHLYGKKYQVGDEESLSSAVQILSGSYFTVYQLDEDNNTIRMSPISRSYCELPESQPVFTVGRGLTGKVMDDTVGELFVSRVEATNEANIECRSYWNKVLKTQFRYFYGKKLSFDGTTAVITVIGARKTYFEEQFFESTIKSFFGFLSEILRLSVPKVNTFIYPNSTKQILSEQGSKEKNIFLMIPYIDNDKFIRIRQAIREVLARYGFNLLIADDKGYCEHLVENLVAYMDACKFGIAVIDNENLNPNIAYELGFLYRAGAKVLILKDQNVNIKDADFMTRLYDQVDLEQIDTVKKKVEKWIKGLLET